MTGNSKASQTETLSICSEMEPQHVSATLNFINKMGVAKPIPESCNTTGFYSHFIGSFINVDQIQRGRISCTVAVKPPISNIYGTMHGGSVGSVIELLSTACARTVVAEDKELFLGEISVSYLSGAPTNEEILADASVVKGGRNVTIVALEFKLKKTGNLMYIAHATFYNFPVAKL
ncbi:uncharacterized protein LOC133303408 [Gastrolobium bilobum]|uniref:uncharacterized protein LOC133303408 n=1 Tax=Gastrolobium bilobum TaxID=150636 RepID=UPI002AAFB3D2|nr:uncharacterized protein LOC133303408 [Gastrolobium bilobum]